MVTCSALPWWAARVGVAVAANGSRFVDVGAEYPVNHLPISLSPAAKPCVLFPWKPDSNELLCICYPGNHITQLKTKVLTSNRVAYLLRRVWSSVTTSSVPTRRIWHPPAPGWTPVRTGDDPGWCTYRTLLPWSRHGNEPDGRKHRQAVVSLI